MSSKARLNNWIGGRPPAGRSLNSAGYRGRAKLRYRAGSSTVAVGVPGALRTAGSSTGRPRVVDVSTAARADASSTYVVRVSSRLCVASVRIRLVRLKRPSLLCTTPGQVLRALVNPASLTKDTTLSLY